MSTDGRKTRQHLPEDSAGPIEPWLRHADFSVMTRATENIQEEVFDFIAHDYRVGPGHDVMLSRFAWIPEEVRGMLLAGDRLCRAAWLAWRNCAVGPRIVGYRETCLSAYRLPVGGLPGWIKTYAPHDVAELAVALSLYPHSLIGEPVGFAALCFEPHSTVDRYLGRTRGMVLYDNQFYGLLSLAGVTKAADVRIIAEQYRWRCWPVPAHLTSMGGIQSGMDSMRPDDLLRMTIDGRSLCAILDERMVLGFTMSGSPDYDAAYRLLADQIDGST